MLTKRQSGCSSQEDRAFTFPDLLATLVIVSVFIAMQFASAASARGKGQSARCLYNHHQLVRAWQLYADENASRVVGNLDGGGVYDIANSNATWVLGWFDFMGGNPVGAQYGGSANTNSAFLTQYSPLARYLDHRPEFFKCPVDTSLSQGTTGIPRVRSYSINGYVGESRPWTTGYKLYKKLSDFAAPDPAHAFVFIDEREDSINDGALLIEMNGYSPSNGGDYRIVDFPADWHNRGANLSFVDGHTEAWRWRDPRTMPTHAFGQLLLLNVASPNNPDVARIQSATSRRNN